MDIKDPEKLFEDVPEDEASAENDGEKGPTESEKEENPKKIFFLKKKNNTEEND